MRKEDSLRSRVRSLLQETPEKSGDESEDSSLQEGSLYNPFYSFPKKVKMREFESYLNNSDASIPTIENGWDVKFAMDGYTFSASWLEGSLRVVDSAGNRRIYEAKSPYWVMSR